MRLDAEVIVEVCDSPAYCRVPSRDYLESALRNLLLNALQYGGRRVRVSVELKDLETKYEIRVKDNGPGISLENKDNIFKRGFRLKGDSSGLGIGLANARQVIEAAGGTLVLESPGSVDEDTCFLISLPRSCTEPISDKWVMVIEEGTQIANYYQSVLDSMGFAVRLADSFESADKVLSHEVSPQFVLADLQIAGESSLPLIRGSREKWGHSLPVLVVTGVRDSKTEVELSELGITQLVYKPVSRKALYSMIESLAQ